MTDQTMYAILKEISGLRADIAKLRADLDPSARALRGWAEVAAALGVSRATLERGRRAVGDETAPRFHSPSEAMSWWRTIDHSRRILAMKKDRRRRSTSVTP